VISVHLTTSRRLRSGLLGRAIDSVLAQTYRDFELIICDDASVDGTDEYLHGIALADQRVRTFRNPRNLNSVAVSLGRCFRESDPERPYVTWMFDDCTLAPRAFEILVDRIARLNTDFVFGITRVHNPDGSYFLVGHHPVAVILRDIATSSSLVPNAGILIKRSVFDRVGWYDPSIVLRRSCDWDLFRRMIEMNCSFDTIKAAVADEYGSTQADSLRNAFTTTFDIMSRYARARDAAHVDLSLNACLNGPIDFIPPGDWSEDQLSLIYAMFIEYYLSVGDLARGYVWAERLGGLLPERPFFFDALVNAVKSRDSSRSLMAAGALAAGYYWTYKEARGMRS
jgi:glycosyltransferase involved in cell wall biosynthesis